MAKFPTFPAIYDDCKTIDIACLTKWSYLKPSQLKTGSIQWSRGKEPEGSTGITVNTISDFPFLEFNYVSNGTPINCRVQLTTLRSNLGKGVVWFFICPHTGRRCRKLHLVGTHFLHRTAFNGCMYDKQTYSNKTRAFHKEWGRVFREDEVYGEIYGKGFRRYYKGKVTKRYLKLSKKLLQNA